MLRVIGYPLLFASRFVLVPLWWLSGLVPRRRDLWVFGSWGGHRFADNAAAFFRHCQANLTGVEFVWISQRADIVRDLRRQGYQAHLSWSPRGMLACLRAGLHLFDCFAKDTNYWVSRGALKVNLWSGVPLKVFEREIDNPRNRYFRLFHGTLPERWLLSLMMPWHVERPDLIIATSQETADITARAFGVPRERVVVTGLPRNDVLLAGDALPGAPALPPAVTAAAKAGETIILYLPTFRDSGSPYDAGLDWHRVDALLAAHKAWLFCKFHPMAATRLTSGLARVVELPQSLDVYPLLARTRALVSDYSSVIFDYMLLGRPIVYFTPDLQAFVSGSRRLNFQPAEIAIGPLCMSGDELLAALDRIARGEDPGGPQRPEDVLPRFHAHVDARASERVLAAIEERYAISEFRRAPVGAR